ncbi:MAG: hypothetical protein ACD_9C00115G0005 [uncultured bacterium]|nr:MAG: hypothetical protein ACD_9C00115G0005 [uncultured bacterium]
MLHITKKNENTHKKAFAVEVFMGLMLLSVFSSSFVQASDITADMVIKLTNKAREKANVAVLAKNELLEKAAGNKAQDMIDNDYFAHVSPQGKTPWYWIEDSGFDYRYAGENLAINFTSAEEEQKAWMDSPLHQKNILNADYEEIGVAVKEGVIDGKRTIVTVQEFGTKMPATVATSDVLENSSSEKSVAGITAFAPRRGENVQKKSELNELFQENKPTIIGWMGVFGVAITVIIIDVAAIFHKKHEQLFILHGARTKHT